MSLTAAIPEQSQQMPVERDAAGLKLAVRELFEEAYLRESIASVMEHADEEAQDRACEELPERALSPGYYEHAAYLLDLGAAMEAGVMYAAGVLLRTDVSGLLAVKQARGEFEREHFACPACGVRQDNRWAMQCRSCSTKFAGKGSN